MEKKTQEWYEEWFNTLYYHILYKHRDITEASELIDNLLAYLMPEPSEKFLDLACGRGRHSVYLSNKGYDVTGVDLSPENIDYARKFENSRLRFAVHDMRKVYKPAAFDYVINLFTSFGYFERRKENQEVVNSICASLKPGGICVIDFLNPHFIPFTENTTEEVIDGIRFVVTKKREEKRVIKEIDITENGKSLYFREVVHLFFKEDFETFFGNAGLQMKHVFGSYRLENYDPATSERLIVIGEKPQ